MTDLVRNEQSSCVPLITVLLDKLAYHSSYEADEDGGRAMYSNSAGVCWCWL